MLGGAGFIGSHLCDALLDLGTQVVCVDNFCTGRQCSSTSEVYGDPQRHPQTEDYVGHVNPIGPRSVYDEAKRFAEAMTATRSPAC